MYIVFTEGFEALGDQAGGTIQTLEQAFAVIVCRCGYAYHFEQADDAWKLVLTDVERPGCSPDPILSSFKKAADAKRDLIAQAVDGRLKGYFAMSIKDFEKFQAEASRRASGTYDAAQVQA